MPDGDPMSASVSKSGAKDGDMRGESGHMDLSKLRSQLTSTSSPSLDQTMMTGYMDLRPTKESMMIKERNRIWRQNARAAKNANKED